MRLYLFAVIVAVGTVSPRAAAQSGRKRADCGVTSTSVMTGRGLGALIVGRPVAEIRVLCDVVLDTVRNDAEGDPARHLAVRIGNDTIGAIIESNRLERVEVRSRKYRTGDSLGVGSAVHAMQAHGAKIEGFGEGDFYVSLVRDCPMSFRLAPPPRTPARTWKEFPSSSRVDLVLLLGC
jgi:hypothetical protein